MIDKWWDSLLKRGARRESRSYPDAVPGSRAADRGVREGEQEAWFAQTRRASLANGLVVAQATVQSTPYRTRREALRHCDPGLSPVRR